MRSNAVGLAGALVQGVLDLVFAPVCLGCGGAIPSSSARREVCSVCWSRARELPHPRCPRCWTPRPPVAVPELAMLSCRGCAMLPPSLRALRSAYVLDGPVRRLVHALKYRGWQSLAGPLGERMADLPLPEEAEEVRLVVPVPLSAVRMRQRGYNQAELLARAIALRRGWECGADVLLRSRATETQTTLHPEERRANVAGAFQVRTDQALRIRGEHLLLVDDVWTTGATALACCEALIRAGARCVSVLTFARALPELDR